MSFFNKGSDAKKAQQPSTKVSSTPKMAPMKSDASKAKSSASSSPMEPKTPQSKGPGLLALNSSAAASSQSSYGGSSYKDTPPSSDPIDVDMASEEESESQRVRIKPVSRIQCNKFNHYLTMDSRRRRNVRLSLWIQMRKLWRLSRHPKNVPRPIVPPLPRILPVCVHNLLSTSECNPTTRGHRSLKEATSVCGYHGG